MEVGVTDVLGICSICHTCFIYRTGESMPTTPHHKFTLKYEIDDNSRAKIQNEINSYNKKLSAFRFARFPLCSTCIQVIIKQISFYSELHQKTSNDLLKISQFVPLDVFKFRLGALEQQKYTNLRLNEQLLSTKFRKIEGKRNEIAQNSENIINSGVLSIPVFILKETSKRTNRKSMYHCMAFRITTNKHYGVINGCPLGFLKYNFPTTQHVNVGFMFLAQLVSFLQNVLVIPSPTIQFTPDPYMAFNDEIFPLIVPERKNKHAIACFNRALDLLFLTVNDIIHIGGALGYKRKPPYKINNENSTIGGQSYLYNPNKLEEWTIALKYLLANLKAEQYRSLCDFLQMQ